MDENKCFDQQVACCCCCSACRFCCRFLSPVKESTTTRLMYTLFLLLGTALMCVMLSSEVQERIIEDYPYYNMTCVKLRVGENCELLKGYMAAYRISFAMASFFLILSIFTIGISSSTGCRPGLHNGLWGWKFLFLCLLGAGAFFIPTYCIEHFGKYWMYIAMCGSFIYILIQLMLIADFAHTWTDNWGEKAERNENRWWYVAMVFCSIIFYTACVVGVSLIAVYYIPRNECKFNKIVLIVNSALCLACSLFSILPTTEKYTGNAIAGLLQSSVISTYVIYLTWSAFSSEPISEQNGILFSCGPSIDVSFPYKNVISYSGVVLMFCTQIFSTIRTSHYSYKLGIRAPKPKVELCACCSYPYPECLRLIEDNGGQKLIRDEVNGVVYSYSFFHVMCFLSCLYIVMQLTHWFRPDNADLLSFEKNWGSVWVKIASSWTCVGVYLITIFVPKICPGRLNRSRSSDLRKIPSQIIHLPEAPIPLPNVGSCDVQETNLSKLHVHGGRKIKVGKIRPF